MKIIVAAVLALTLCGCKNTGLLAPAPAYVPGQQFGDGGATPCMNGVCPVINEPKQWLRPCK